MPPIPWLITREADVGEPVVAALRTRGIDARCVPFIERTPLRWPISFAASPDPLWFVTSPYCARLVVTHTPRHRLEHVAAIAPATARVFEEAGIHVEVSTGGGVVELAKAVVATDIEHASVLYPTSDAGLSSPEQLDAVAILGAWAPVGRASRTGGVYRDAVYTTKAPASLASSLEPLRGAPYFVVAWSPSAIESLFDAVRDGAPSPAFIACVGESTKRAHDDNRVALAAELVPRGVDVVDYVFAYPHKPVPSRGSA